MTDLSIPDLATLRTRLQSGFDAWLNTKGDAARRRVLKVLADVLGGGLWGEYKYLQNMADEYFVSTCTSTYLDRRATELGLSRTGATTAAGNVIFTGTTGIGVPSGTELLYPDGTTTCKTQAAVTLASGTATVAVVADAGGEAGNASAGASLTFVSAVAGVNSTVTVDPSGLTGGADAESDSSLRSRVLARLRHTPQAGASSDFYTVARAVSGVTRAWIFPRISGNGTVGVTFAIDGRTSPIPLAADIAAMEAAIAAYIDTITVSVFAPTADSTDVTIANLVISSDATLSTVEAAIRTALADLFSTRPSVGGAYWGDAGLDAGAEALSAAGKMPLSAIYSAIADAAGVVGFDLTAPTADIASASQHLAVLGTVTISA